MSDLLTVTDYDSPAFVDRVRCAFQQCCQHAERATSIQSTAEKRISGIKRHTFETLVEIGESFLRLQEARPGEFEVWFSAHEEQLQMCLRTAVKCKAQAQNVRRFGLDHAFNLSITGERKAPIAPFLTLNLRLTRDISELTDDERAELRKRLAPAVDIDHRLAAMGVASPS